ncbi:MAG: FkbM family methyltransferase [Ignavibacteriae bacterium]|nr:FkbM family methyltransferase [Ignavibacteriota bacterium]
MPKHIVTTIKKIQYTQSTREISDESAPEFKIISQLIHPGETVIDIGANLGMYTKYLSDIVSSTGTVVSIEPIKETFEILQHIVRSLKMNNVLLYNNAVSDSQDTLLMEIPLYENGEENFYEAQVVKQKSNSAYRTVLVNALSLDLMCSSLNKISFIKCDVEGHEYECLQGASSILNRWKPSIYIEIQGNIEDVASRGYKTVRFLQNLSYDIYMFRGTTLWKRQPGEFNTNYFFLTPDHIHNLKAQQTIALHV